MSTSTTRSTRRLGTTGLAIGAVLAFGAGPVAAADITTGHPTTAPSSELRTGAGDPQSEPHLFVRAASDVTRARRATARFRTVRTAVRAGYELPAAGPLHQCITDYQNSGAMGFHFVNAARAGDTLVDPTKPEALVYHRNKAGRVRLGALEYVVFAEAWDRDHQARPVVLGQEMMLVPAPNRYELPAFYMLHAWLWKHNPAGRFSSYNPAVSCHADQPPAVGQRREPGNVDGPVQPARGRHPGQRQAV